MNEEQRRENTRVTSIVFMVQCNFSVVDEHYVNIYRSMHYQCMPYRLKYLKYMCLKIVGPNFIEMQCLTVSPLFYM